MRYVVVPPDGQVLVMKGDEATIAGLLHKYEAVAVGDVSIYYEPNAAGKYNWQATRLAKEVLMPDDRICGDVVLFGPPVEGHPTDIREETLTLLQERHAARG